MRAHRQDIQWRGSTRWGDKHTEWLTVVTVCAERAEPFFLYSKGAGLPSWKTGRGRSVQSKTLRSFVSGEKKMKYEFHRHWDLLLEADQIKRHGLTDTINIARVFFLSLLTSGSFSFFLSSFYASVCFLSYVWGEWHFAQIQILFAFNMEESRVSV